MSVTLKPAVTEVSQETVVIEVSLEDAVKLRKLLGTIRLGTGMVSLDRLFVALSDTLHTPR